VALFDASPVVYDLLEQADEGRVALGVPTTCLAEAEATLRAGTGWDAILETPQVQALPLNAHAAVEVGVWPGSLPARHAVHEASVMDATVVTCRPSDYEGLNVPLLVV
jgi:hypothetical protein